MRKVLKVLAESGQHDSVLGELDRRLDEVEGLNKNLELLTQQQGSSVPQTFASVNAFIANPSTVSVETFKRMIDTDETIGSGIDFLILCLTARFGEYKHPNDKIENFVRKALMEMDGSWHEDLSEMFSAEWAGFSLTEIVWKMEDSFLGGKAWLPKKIVTYQPLTVVFAVDQAGEILPNGIFQYQRFFGQNNSVYGYNLSDDGFRPDLLASRGDFSTPIRTGQNVMFNSVCIPREKCIHLKSSVTGKFGNPYGRSTLRRIYKSWVAKDTALKLWIIAMDRKASPLIVGYAPPNDTTGGGLDENGNYIQGVRADVALANILRNMHNDSAFVLPGKKGEQFEVDTVQTQSDMSVFKDHIEYDNRAIMRGLLIPPMILGGDGGGSYALADAHRDILQQVIDGKLKPYKQGIIEQLVAQIIRHNFSREDYKEGFGEFIVEEFDTEVMNTLSNIYNTLTTAGYMSPTDQADMDTICEKFKLPPRKAKAAMDNVADSFDFGDEEPTVQSELPEQAAPAQPDVQSSVLNGAQVTSLVDVVKSVNTNEISRETAMQVIMTAFNVDQARASALLGPKIEQPAEPEQAAPAAQEEQE